MAKVGGCLMGVAAGWGLVVSASCGMKVKGGSLMKFFAVVDADTEFTPGSGRATGGLVWAEDSMCHNSFFDSGTCWLPAGVLEVLGRGAP